MMPSISMVPAATVFQGLSQAAMLPWLLASLLLTGVLVSVTR